MAYIGNTATTQAFTPAIDYFSGNGSTTAFTLSRTVASTAQVQAVIENVPQNPGSAFTVSGNTITFTSAPPSGTNNIYVYYVSLISQVDALPQSPQVFGNLQMSSPGARITGDFSNATVANRVMFQTSTTNGATSVYILPNGTSTTSQFVAVNNSDPTNASVLQLQANATEYQIRGGITGTGTYLPMTFYTGGSERMRLDTSGNVGIGTSSPVVPLELIGQQNISARITAGAGVGTLLIKGSKADSNGFFLTQDNSTDTATINNYYNGPLVFKTNNTERARIDSSGNLLAYKTMQVNTSSTGTYGTATFYTRLTSGTAYTIATGTSLSQDTLVVATLEYGVLYDYTNATVWNYGMRQAFLRGSTSGTTNAGNSSINSQTSGSGPVAPSFAWTGTSPITLVVTSSASNEGWAKVTVAWRNVTMSFNPVA